jgi:hypothetical protein
MAGVILPDARSWPYTAGTINPGYIWPFPSFDFRVFLFVFLLLFCSEVGSSYFVQSVKMSISKTVFKLNTGAEIPALGLGMYPLTNPTITPPFLQFLHFLYIV